MITFYHASNSRSSSVLALLHALGALDAVEIRRVGIRRGDGSGQRDPANAHPEGKVPYLVTETDRVRERAAIFTWLCECFPAARMAPQPGEAGRGQFLSWMAYYQGVIEPVMVAKVLGIDDPRFRATFRGPDELAAELAAALEEGPWLMGARYSAADMLLASPFLFFPAFTPEVPSIRDWVARCGQNPSVLWAQREDAETLVA